VTSFHEKFKSLIEVSLRARAQSFEQFLKSYIDYRMIFHESKFFYTKKLSHFMSKKTEEKIFEYLIHKKFSSLTVVFKIFSLAIQGVV
jgi:hypothetical protein